MEIRSIERQQTDWSFLLLLFVTTTYLYLNLFASLHIPFLLGGDQTYFWMDAQRILGGERIYHDFFRYTPPGTDLLYAALFKLFGIHVWVTNAAVLALGAAYCWLCFSLSSKIMEHRSALLATALFMVAVYGKALNGTNHWFAVLAIMVAVNIGMEKMPPGRIAAAGALLGWLHSSIRPMVWRRCSRFSFFWSGDIHERREVQPIFLETWLRCFWDIPPYYCFLASPSSSQSG